MNKQIEHTSLNSSKFDGLKNHKSLTKELVNRFVDFGTINKARVVSKAAMSKISSYRRRF